MAINLYLAKRHGGALYPAVTESAAKSLQRPLKILDAALQGRDWLVGDAFSMADLNVASVMYLMKAIRFGYAEHADVQRWADACYARRLWGGRSRGLDVNV
jgi:glutathione S-transferase